MGKKANARRKEIVVEVLGHEPGYRNPPKRSRIYKKVESKAESSKCCYDKYDELPVGFRRCYGCPKES